MYLGLVLVVLGVLFAIVGIFSGGAFTFVLLPLAVFAAIAAAVALWGARAAGVDGTLSRQPGPPAGGQVRGDAEPPPGEAPATPEDYVRARQHSQAEAEQRSR